MTETKLMNQHIKELLKEIEKMEDYAMKIQEENLTEFMRGYWKGQENLIKELKKEIKKLM